MHAASTVAAFGAAVVIAMTPGIAGADGWGNGSAIDGDTIRLDNGKSVRVIGIDTPESGECGSGKAEKATARFIRNGFTLRRATRDNEDRYDRLLRYVRNRNGRDLGTMLIRRGLAVARYDSRDGYGWHRLQARYHRLDRRQRNVCGFDPTRPRDDDGGRSCDANYKGTCVPKVSHDLDCADVNGPVRVVGSDPHGFDADNDGIGCETG